MCNSIKVPMIFFLDLMDPKLPKSFLLPSIPIPIITQNSPKNQEKCEKLGLFLIHYMKKSTELTSS